MDSLSEVQRLLTGAVTAIAVLALAATSQLGRPPNLVMPAANGLLLSDSMGAQRRQNSKPLLPNYAWYASVGVPGNVRVSVSR